MSKFKKGQEVEVLAGQESATVVGKATVVVRKPDANGCLVIRGPESAAYYSPMTDRYTVIHERRLRAIPDRPSDATALFEEWMSTSLNIDDWFQYALDNGQILPGPNLHAEPTSTCKWCGEQFAVATGHDCEPF